MILDDIVGDYISRFRKRAGKELRWFSIQRTLEDAVEVSALAKGPSGKRLSHQRRIPGSVLHQSRRRLLECLPALRRVRTFEKLHSLVASNIQDIPGIGELTVYDTALRLGAKLGLEPNVVYLHAGTRAGARRLGFAVSREFLTMKELPPALRRLRPQEIEDVLCIYKDRFSGKGVANLRRRCYDETESCFGG